jgi:hypothetical protein
MSSASDLVLLNGTTSVDVGKSRRIASKALRDFPAFESPTTTANRCRTSASSRRSSLSRRT